MHDVLDVAPRSGASNWVLGIGVKKMFGGILVVVAIRYHFLRSGSAESGAHARALRREAVLGNILGPARPRFRLSNIFSRATRFLGSIKNRAKSGAP